MAKKIESKKHVVSAKIGRFGKSNTTKIDFEYRNLLGDIKTVLRRVVETEVVRTIRRTRNADLGKEWKVSK